MHNRIIVAAGALALAVAAPSAQAHHTFAMFDLTKTVSINGTLKDVQWTNPHIWLVVMSMEPDGSAKQWSIEGGAPNALMRKGWKYGDLKVGRKVTVTIHPLKTGQAGGSLLTLTFDDGKSYEDGVSDNKV